MFHQSKQNFISKFGQLYVVVVPAETIEKFIYIPIVSLVLLNIGIDFCNNFNIRLRTVGLRENTLSQRFIFIVRKGSQNKSRLPLVNQMIYQTGKCTVSLYNLIVMHHFNNRKPAQRYGVPLCIIY